MYTVDDNQKLTDYSRISRAIAFIREHRLEQPDLQAIAQQVGLSPYHFQRLFVRWAGVSPRQFMSFLTLQHAKQLLRNNVAVLDTALEVGLSGSGRLHDQFVRLQAMTPGEYKTNGADLLLHYSFQSSGFGLACVLRTARGICSVRFLEDTQKARQAVLDAARQEWPLSQFVADEAAINPFASLLEGGAVDRSIPLLVKGSAFQIQVWQALLMIPEGAIRGYSDIAQAIGRPQAARAVGSAIGANPIAYLIPCHRVLRADGSFSGYRWGVERKMAMLGWEAARATA